MDNLFEQAARMALVQAEGYRQVRERARNEALEEAAKVCDEAEANANHGFSAMAAQIRALKERT